MGLEEQSIFTPTRDLSEGARSGASPGKEDP